MRCASESPRRVAVVLPAYNERLALARLLPRLDALTRHVTYGITVVVVDDGSSDGTAVSLGAGPAERVALRHPQNRGYGAALSTGLHAALRDADVVVTMDADDTHDPSLIPAMVDALMAGCDVVIASRYAAGSTQIGVPLHRVALSLVANQVMRVLGPCAGVVDHSCGFRAFRASALLGLGYGGAPRVLRERGFAASLELLLEAGGRGARIRELPFCLRYDRKPSPSAMTLMRTLWCCARVLWRYSRVGPLRSSARPLARRFSRRRLAPAVLP